MTAECGLSSRTANFRKGIEELSEVGKEKSGLLTSVDLKWCTDMCEG